MPHFLYAIDRHLVLCLARTVCDKIGMAGWAERKEIKMCDMMKPVVKKAATKTAAKKTTKTVKKTATKKAW